MKLDEIKNVGPINTLLNHIYNTYYVYGEEFTGPDAFRLTIEEQKEKYEIDASMSDRVVVTVSPDMGTGASRSRAKEIQRDLSNIR